MSKKPTSSTYHYQKAKVPCTCRECRDSFGPAGQLIPFYTRRRHREKDQFGALKGKGKRARDATDGVPFEETQAFKRYKRLQIGKPGHNAERVPDSGASSCMLVTRTEALTHSLTCMIKQLCTNTNYNYPNATCPKTACPKITRLYLNRTHLKTTRPQTTRLSLNAIYLKTMCLSLRPSSAR
jgi:hypothetical protein